MLQLHGRIGTVLATERGRLQFRKGDGGPGMQIVKLIQEVRQSFTCALKKLLVTLAGRISDPVLPKALHDLISHEAQILRGPPPPGDG